MRTLVLTSQLGNGHTRAAEAVEAALLRKDPQMRIHRLDLWTLMDAKVAAALKDGYLQIATEHPEIYDQLYHARTKQQLLGKEPLPPSFAEVLDKLVIRWFPKRWFAPRTRNIDQAVLVTLLDMLTGRVSSVPDTLIRSGLLLWIRSLLLRRLKAELARFAPDIVIATQVYLAALMMVVKRRGDFIGTPTLGVLTDYGIHEFWVQFGTSGDYCVATDAIARQLHARGIAPERVHATGIPLMPEFSHPPSQAEARHRLGLDAHARVVLVTGGWFGIGVSEAVKGLMDCALDSQVMVTIGRAEAGDIRKLRQLAKQYRGRLRLIEWSDEMPVLLRAADVVVGKPGGLSVAEALACGRPFFATTSLGGQEGFNLQFLEQHGVGRQVSLCQLFNALHGLLSSPEKLLRAQEQAWKLGRRESAEQIAALAVTHAKSQGGAGTQWAAEKF
ncbi:MAG: MGDG synthase family glycosyltransferase [Gammaproteobacteria bacterium]